MKKTDFRRNLDSLIISKVYACGEVRLAEAAALMVDCDQCTLKRDCEESGEGCTSTFYKAIVNARREAEHDGVLHREEEKQNEHPR